MSESIFYSAIRNAQPLAFLGSLCIIIAVFTYQSETIPNVYPNAISASISFIIAFITSLISQFLSKAKGWETLELYTKFATYFFLFMGILHIIAVIISFGHITSEIFLTISGWVYGLTATFSLIILVRYYEKKENKEKFSLENKFDLTSTTIAFLGSSLVLIIHLVKLFLNIEILDNQTSFYIFIVSVGQRGFLNLIEPGIYNLIKKIQKKPKISIWKKLRKISFKWQLVIFVSVFTVVFLMIYAWCGSILKIDCHQVILGR